MPPLFRLRLPLFVLLASSLSAFAEPVLLVKRAGAEVPVSELADWKPGLGKEQYGVKAELSELDGLAYWWPSYTLRHSDGLQRERFPAVDARLTLGLELRELVDMEGNRKLSELSSIWSDANPKEGLLLVAWIVDGQVAKLFPAVSGGVANGELARLQVNANLSEAETRGYPVMLFWSKGHFLPANPVRMDSTEAVAFRAAVKDDAAALARVLGEGVSAKTTDVDGYSLAEYAAGAGAVKSLEVLRANNAGFKAAEKSKQEPPRLRLVNSRQAHEISPLELAASRGRTEAVRFLIASGVSPDGRDEALDSPLYCAAEGGHLETVKALVAVKAKVEQQTHSNTTSVAAAINEGFPDVAEFLLKNGGSFEFSSPNNRKVFLTLCREGKFAMVRFFVDHGSQVKHSIEGASPLIEAAGKGSAAFAEYLLKQGASLEAQDEYKRTALIMACVSGNEPYARALLAAGAKVSAQSSMGTTPLHAAIFRQKYELVKDLLAAGAPTGLRNRNELTPLDSAVIIGAWECVDPFLKAGGRLDPKSPIIAEELQSILRGDQVDLLAQLVQGGLPLDYKAPGGWSLLRLADLAKATRCASLLREAGARFDANDPVPLAKAAEIDPGFKFISGNPPTDPRPEGMSAKGASMTVRVLVDGEGRVRFTLIDECAEPLLCMGLAQTVESWRFTPPTKAGKPVSIWVAQQVKFLSAKERAAARPKADEMPRPIKQVAPVYPFDARKRGQMAEVVVGFVVDEKGDVQDAHVLSTSGDIFNEPALTCVRKWKFVPGKIKGTPVRVELSVPIRFSLSGH